MQQQKGLALQDIIRDVHLYMLRIPFTNPDARIYLLDQVGNVVQPRIREISYPISQLSNIEHRLSTGTMESVQLGSLVGACTVARDIEVGGK